jgi:prepilin-type N-terminal cleavage/methylation domain-containing protein
MIIRCTRCTKVFDAEEPDPLCHRCAKMDLAERMAAASGQTGTPLDERRIRRRAFTLIELLIVIVIIVTVSAIAIPTVLPALSHREVSEAARILQAAIVGARDAALRDQATGGIRLLPDPLFLTRLASGAIDPTQPLVANRFVPLMSPPSYEEGLASIFPADAYPAAILGPGSTLGSSPALVVEESVGQWISSGGASVFAPNSPTSWAWNIRVGDSIQFNNAGPWYTVVGPMVTTQPSGNSELFVNIGAPGTVSPISRTLTGPNGQTVTVNPEFLLLTNGIDDNANGYVDEGWDGIDNNNNGVIDDPGPIDPTGKTFGEWETETWRGSLAAGQVSNIPYAIRRRPAPTSATREVALPTNVVIDLTTWHTTRERSSLPVNPLTGEVDVIINSDGSVNLAPFYSTPASVGLAGAFLDFGLVERSDISAPIGTTPPTLPAPAGEWGVVDLSTRTGRVTYAANPPAATPFQALHQGVQ